MKIVIWGHKLHSHTHSYIHHGFYRAFLYMGHSVVWLDDDTDVSGFDFSNSLFLTEGQVDKNIPIRDDCRYLLHYCDPSKYESVKSRCLCIERTIVSEKARLKKTAEKLDEWTYLEKNYTGTHGWKIFDEPIGIPALYLLWGTNLLPYEFNYENLLEGRQDKVTWVGSIGTSVYGNVKELGPFALACLCDHKAFEQKGPHVIPDIEHQECIRTSYVAPTIVGTWQLKHGYIPCRVFKNISYGQPTFTNSKDVADVMEGRIPYNEDTFQLYYDGQQFAWNVDQEKMIEMMKFVEHNHTYINRVKAILQCLPK